MIVQFATFQERQLKPLLGEFEDRTVSLDLSDKNHYGVASIQHGYADVLLIRQGLPVGQQLRCIRLLNQCIERAVIKPGQTIYFWVGLDWRITVEVLEDTENRIIQFRKKA